MIQRNLVLIVCLFISGCATQSPPRADPLADLVGGAKIPDSPTRTITESRSKTLALIVSTSTQTQIKHREETDNRYLEGYVKSQEPGSYNTVKAMYESVSPHKLRDTVVAELRQRFKTVSVVGDLAEFRDGGHDVAAVVDVGMEYKASSGLTGNSAEYTTDVSLHLFDRQIRKIGLASGKATESGKYDASGDIAKAVLLVFPDPKPEDYVRPMVEAERKSRVSAFKRLSASLDQIVQK
ncbi:MAG: hypothetical protein K9J42_07575 [Sulfuritalea sp.]|nr:hypothetical protein [Sulfuritalea sp.]